MTEKIGGYPRPGTETKQISSRSAERTSRSDTTPVSHSTTGDDAVSLTDTATRLKTIEARIRELPDVDRERVAELRSLIDSGEYEIDSQLIARRLVQLERALS